MSTQPIDNLTGLIHWTVWVNINRDSSSSLWMEIVVHLTAVIAQNIWNGMTKSSHKANKYAKLRRCFVGVMLVWVDSSGLAMTEQCSLLLVTLTTPTGQIIQTMWWLHWLSTTTKDLWGSSHGQVFGKRHLTSNSSGWSALRNDLFINLKQNFNVFISPNFLTSIITHKFQIKC